MSIFLFLVHVMRRCCMCPYGQTMHVCAMGCMTSHRIISMLVCCHVYACMRMCFILRACCHLHMHMHMHMRVDVLPLVVCCGTGWHRGRTDGEERQPCNNCRPAHDSPSSDTCPRMHLDMRIVAHMMHTHEMVCMVVRSLNMCARMIHDIM